jgi:uncharacterized protein (UPF0548 family)
VAVPEVRRLPATEEQRLRSETFTYPGVGASSAPPYPSGFSPIEHRALIGGGRTDFERAADQLMGWQLQARAGLHVSASTERVAPGEVVLMRIGVGPLSLRIPCRVVYVIDEPDRRGFAYGSLPGHPESGEERFEVVLEPDDRVTLLVSGFSRPGTLLTRLAGPLTRVAVAAAVRRYGQVMRQK